MVKYEVIVATSNLAQATTTNNVFIKLVGTDGESKRTWLTSVKGAATFYLGAESKFSVSCPTSLGKLVLIELDKKPLPMFPEDNWFPSKIKIKSPEGDTYYFPIYRWIAGCEVHLFREGTALRIFDDNHHLGKYCREKELKLREELYSWFVYKEGLPHCMKADNCYSLPYEVRFSFTKTKEFGLTAITGLAELKLKRLTSSKGNWSNIDAIKNVFCNKKTAILDAVQPCQTTSPSLMRWCFSVVEVA